MLADSGFWADLFTVGLGLLNAIQVLYLLILRIITWHIREEVSDLRADLANHHRDEGGV